MSWAGPVAALHLLTDRRAAIPPRTAPSRREQTLATYARYERSPGGRAARVKAKERRRAYHREWYYRNIERRRAYLSEKQREYRARARG